MGGGMRHAESCSLSTSHRTANGVLNGEQYLRGVQLYAHGIAREPGRYSTKPAQCARRGDEQRGMGVAAKVCKEEMGAA